ncbi:carbon-nitrogen family hydrolase [Staphylococcus edaphicus]|uniref:Carbon-nitrogen family hydrolase n=1 Tax=Staphylococcus edaphicus TaxID=1955013 RepID=A0A2C6WKL1_9STAP|nr:carbon-nitrogen family hydrolase [Staphylococcus edaphicus]PHK48693.1 carbon-nitrogen hydrolase [Staphylococcus edaphicus]UQW82361.1 carbon-nitrogen family hydrolase [Staphylococcus edaphicus]
MDIEIFQFKVEPANPDLNEETISKWFSNYVTTDTDVVVLPEMWNNGYALPQLKELSDNQLTRSFEFISKLAIKYHVDIIAGSVSNTMKDEVFNTAFAVSKNGYLLNNYDKVHLVPMLDEPSFLNAGNAVPEPFNLTNGAIVTQIICYDLRFPELLRYPARKDAQIAFYVAQWPLVRLDHWIALLKARAIENDMYVIGCNGCGDDGQTEYAGHSIVINPNGEIISQLDDKLGHITCQIDLEAVAKQRDAIPVFKNLRPQLYK